MRSETSSLLLIENVLFQVDVFLMLFLGRLFGSDSRYLQVQFGVENNGFVDRFVLLGVPGSWFRLWFRW